MSGFNETLSQLYQKTTLRAMSWKNIQQFEKCQNKNHKMKIQRCDDDIVDDNDDDDELLLWYG